MARSVVGLCDSRRDAEVAFRDLESAGFRGNNGSCIDTATSRLASGLVRAGIPEADASIDVAGCSGAYFRGICARCRALLYPYRWTFPAP